MSDVYNFQQHTHCVIFHLAKTTINAAFFSTSKRPIDKEDELITKETCITFDERKMNVLSWGDKYFERDNERNIRIDRFRENLYKTFEKGKSNWDPDDLFLLQAVSYFMRLLVEKIIRESDERNVNVNALHYIFVVPSDWKIEIRETVIRQIFCLVNLLSKDDHKDRLLFYSDTESIFHLIKNPDEDIVSLEKGKNTTLCILRPYEDGGLEIKFNLVSTINPAFDFAGAPIYPEIVRSHSQYLNIDDITDSIRSYIDTQLPISIQDEVIKIILDTNYSDAPFDMETKKKMSYLDTPLFTETSRWKLNIEQEEFLKRMCLYKIIDQKNIPLVTTLMDISTEKLKNKGGIFIFKDKYSSDLKLDPVLLRWFNYFLEYKKFHYTTRYNGVYKGCLLDYGIKYQNILMGARRYGFDVIQNSDINRKPLILPVQNSNDLSSIFLKSNADAIMNIDISPDTILLSFSLLEEKGLIKKNWGYDYFVTDLRLPSLDYFFTISETVTLNVKYSFIKFTENYSLDYISSLTDYKTAKFYKEIETILCKNNDNEDLLISTQYPIHIKLFILIYMMYINQIVLSKLSTIADYNTDLKVGYNITIEKLLLDHLFGTKEDLKDIIYLSGLVPRDDNSKKIRIFTQGEKILRSIQPLQLPLRSFFVVTRLFENYIELTQNQVVTEYGQDGEDQEVIITLDKIIHIPNLYDSVCLNMWNSIVKDGSLIRLCNMHDNSISWNSPNILSYENQTEFTSNLKQYISKNHLNEKETHQVAEKITVQLSGSCNCKVHLAVNDILNISFLPVIQDIASLVSSTLVNNEVFKKCWDIQYIFQLINFSYNMQLQCSLIKMLKDTTDDYMQEKGIYIPHHAVPELLNQRLQPILRQQPFSYQEFHVGVLHHIYSENYGFGFSQSNGDVNLEYKSNMTDTKTVLVDEQTVFPLLKKGDKIGNRPTTRLFYLKSQQKTSGIELYISYFQLKTAGGLKPNGTVCSENISEKVRGVRLHDVQNSFTTGQYSPIEISISYDANTSFLSFTLKIFGGGRGDRNITTLPEPMHLSRF